MVVNRKVVLTKRPEGKLSESDFRVVEENIGEIGEGEVLLQVEYLSIDAFIRTTLDGPEGLHGTMNLDSAVTALGIGRVKQSNFEGLNQGDAVFGPMGAQTQVIWPGSMLRKLEETEEIKASTYLGSMGMTTGLTAYVGLILVGKIKEGDTVAVSAAAGAVGCIVCQLAKIKGAKIIGIAGGKKKCDFLKSELGCDEAIDYKSGDLTEKIKQVVPEGIDVFFDNVGGEVLDAALDNIASGARVVICGAISQYNNMENVVGPKLYLRIPERNASMLGFTVDHFADQFPKIEKEIITWIQEDKLNLPEHIEKGIENFPKSLVKLMTGGHMGKLLVEL